jgi:large conductance mechanosensitive channel
MLKGFRDFVTRGNLIEVAVGLVMALATFALVQALVTDLNDSEFRYGDFINATITFVSTAAAVYFFVVMPYQEYQRRRGITPSVCPCPECTTDIPVAARRCPSCTATVAPAG